MIKRLPSLQLIDGKSVAWEERERAEVGSGATMPGVHQSSQIVSQIAHNQHLGARPTGDGRFSMYPSILHTLHGATHSQVPSRQSQQSNQRVPVKVTSVTFECFGGMSGMRNEAPMMAIGNKNILGFGAVLGGDIPLTRVIRV